MIKKKEKKMEKKEEGVIQGITNKIMDQCFKDYRSLKMKVVISVIVVNNRNRRQEALVLELKQ